jgi:hypothetical protein
MNIKRSCKRDIIKSLCRGHNLSYYEKDAKRMSSLKLLDKYVKNAVAMRPCVMHIRNFKSLIHIIANRVAAAEEPQRKLSRFIKNLLHDELLSISKTITDTYPFHIILSCDKFDDGDMVDNDIKNYFDYYFQMPTVSERERKIIIELVLKKHLGQSLKTKLVQEEKEAAEEKMNLPEEDEALEDQGEI